MPRSRPAAGRRRAALAMATSLTLLVTGCGGKKPDAPKQEAPKAGTSDINPQARDKLKPGGTLRLSIYQWITQYNVGQVDGTQGDGAAILELTQPVLWNPDENGVSHLNPDVLASAEVTATAPNQVVTYRLNPKATWSDGTPITWQDFATQWRTRNGTDPAYVVADSTGYSLISGVQRGADDREAKVTFSKPYADWQKLFNPLLPGKTLDTPEKFNKGWIEKVPVWGGPWKPGKLDKQSQTITVVPNDTYWGTKPVLDSIIFRAMDSNAFTDAFLNKEIDQAPARQSEAYKRLAPAPDTTIRVGSRWDETHLTLGSAGPLADVSVRQAIGLALDRQAIAKVQGGDLPYKINVLDNHFFMPNQEGYQDNTGGYATYSPSRAGDLLTAAGWTQAAAGQTRTKGGKPLTLTYVVNSGGSLDVPQVIQNMLGQVGIKVELRQVPGNDFFEKYVNRGAFDLVSFRQVDILFPSDAISIFRTGGEQNFGKVGSPEIDKLLQAASVETDKQKSIALYNQADALIWKQGHSIELFQTPQINAVRTGLANFGSYGLRSDDQYVNVGFVN